ncbi:MAG: hypothetical protein QOG11_1826, partial [Solirubrobacteraceae bacterium]|nr:hypothetical protein [Solirubrobacteraceae bacterium]
MALASVDAVQAALAGARDLADPAQ